MNTKKIFTFLVKNYFLTIFIGIIFFVSIIATYKLAFSKPTYIYAKVKLGQGLWWANTNDPSIWLVKSIKKGDIEKDFLGRPIAEILNVRYYPVFESNQFTTYLTIKLKVSVNKKEKKYSFKRATIGVGSPIDFEFSGIQTSGTVTAISENNIEDKLADKIVYLTKRYAYPWEFDAIKIGDSYFDGETTVFEILEKQLKETDQILPVERYGQANVVDPSLPESRRYIFVKAKIKVKEENNQYIYGESQIVTPGKSLSISTKQFNFRDFIVAGIE